MMSKGHQETFSVTFLQSSETDTVAGSSNFGKFMELFESEDSRWIDEINAELEK